MLTTSSTGARCKHEFCWSCLARYDGPTGIYVLGNEGHNEGCRQTFCQRLLEWVVAASVIYMLWLDRDRFLWIAGNIARQLGEYWSGQRTDRG